MAAKKTELPFDGFFSCLFVASYTFLGDLTWDAVVAEERAARRKSNGHPFECPTMSNPNIPKPFT